VNIIFTDSSNFCLIRETIFVSQQSLVLPAHVANRTLMASTKSFSQGWSICLFWIFNVGMVR